MFVHILQNQIFFCKIKILSHDGKCAFSGSKLSGSLLSCYIELNQNSENYYHEMIFHEKKVKINSLKNI